MADGCIIAVNEGVAVGVSWRVAVGSWGGVTVDVLAAIGRIAGVSVGIGMLKEVEVGVSTGDAVRGKGVLLASTLTTTVCVLAPLAL